MGSAEDEKPRKKLSEKELNIMTMRLSDAIDNYPEFKDRVIELLNYKVWSGVIDQKSFLKDNINSKEMVEKYNPLLEIVYGESAGSRNNTLKKLEALEMKLESLPPDSFIDFRSGVITRAKTFSKYRRTMNFLLSRKGLKYSAVITPIALLIFLNVWLSSITNIGPKHFEFSLLYLFYSFISIFLTVLLSGKFKRNVLIYLSFVICCVTSSVLFGEYLNHGLGNTVNSINIYKGQGVLLGIALVCLLLYKNVIIQ